MPLLSVNGEGCDDEDDDDWLSAFAEGEKLNTGEELCTDVTNANTGLTDSRSLIVDRNQSRRRSNGKATALVPFTEGDTFAKMVSGKPRQMKGTASSRMVLFRKMCFFSKLIAPPLKTFLDGFFRMRNCPCL